MLTLIDAGAGTDYGRLAAALEHELRLVEELRDALLRQRAGVAADDAQAIEDSVHAIGRTLCTLEEARRRRAAITAALAGSETATLDDLERRADGPLPARLTEARDRLRRAAEAAARETAINQTILRRALEAGDAFLQQLFSSAQDPTPVYAPGPRSAEPRAGAMLVNRTA